jgi:predicted transposase YbfD/YdcC
MLVIISKEAKMAAKKGKIPEHVKQKQKKFCNPKADHPVIKIFNDIDDPRKPSLTFSYSLTSILFMTLMAVISGATDWAKVAVMSEGMVDWLAQYVDMSSGVPCERTFTNIFNAITPEALEDALQKVSNLMRERIPQEVISFDGQTERGTAEKRKGLSGIHLMNAWSSDNRICLGQIKVDDKSNEIIAMPQLMDMLDLKGTIITADAMNTQKATAKKAIDNGADYVLPVKGNQPSLLKDIHLAFEGLDKELANDRVRWENEIKKAKEHRDRDRLEKLLKKGPQTYNSTHWDSEIGKVHGRIESRSCTTMPVGDLPSKEGWEGIQSIARIRRERAENGVTSQEITYYITSLKPIAAIIGDVAKEHWGVEVQHWYLDVVFRQDKSRYRNRIGARNLAAIRKIALNGLLRENSLKRGIATKQCAAACNPSYREKILKKLF